MLCLHHCLLAVKGEIDQLCEGTTNLGVLAKIRSTPNMFARFFLGTHLEELTAGMYLHADSFYTPCFI